MKAAATTGLLADAIYKQHDTGPGHPEQPARFDAVMNAIAPVRSKMTPLYMSSANDDELEMVHSVLHLQQRRGGGSLRAEETWAR